MIKYDDIIRQITILEKRKLRNEEKIKSLSETNNSIISDLKILYQRKEQFEKMDSEISKIVEKRGGTKSKRSMPAPVYQNNNS